MVGTSILGSWNGHWYMVWKIWWIRKPTKEPWNNGGFDEPSKEISNEWWISRFASKNSGNFKKWEKGLTIGNLQIYQASLYKPKKTCWNKWMGWSRCGICMDLPLIHGKLRNCKIPVSSQPQVWLNLSRLWLWNQSRGFIYSFEDKIFY